MARGPFARLGVRLLALVLLAGCTRDSATPLDPTAVTTPSPALLSWLQPVRGVTRDTPLARDIEVSATIGPKGGTLTIPEAGLTLVVPPKAVNANVTFTATALAGNAVAYDFQPHGMKFAVPLQFTQDLRKTSVLTLATAPLLDGAYFADNRQVDRFSAFALVNEISRANVDLLRFRVGFPIEHFSGYLVSWH